MYFLSQNVGFFRVLMAILKREDFRILVKYSTILSIKIGDLGYPKIIERGINNTAVCKVSGEGKPLNRTGTYIASA